MSFIDNCNVVDCDRQGCGRKSYVNADALDPIGYGWRCVYVRAAGDPLDHSEEQRLRHATKHSRHWCPKCWPIISDLLKENGALP